VLSAEERDLLDVASAALHRIDRVWLRLPSSFQQMVLTIAQCAEEIDPGDDDEELLVRDPLFELLHVFEFAPPPPLMMSRRELYEQVWTMPATKLKHKLGVSDVAIGKACRRHEIPRPGAGYWAMLRIGRLLPKKPLGRASSKALETVSFYPPPSRSRPNAGDVR
jgi:hypothetical protein